MNHRTLMSPHIAIYGAAADTPPQRVRSLSWLAGLKRSVKMQRDLFRLRQGADFPCDYRDYNVEHVTNIGDIAIAETIRRELRHLSPDCTFSNIDWGNIRGLETLHAGRKIDFLVVAGGGYFLFNHAGELPSRLHEELAFLLSSGIPYVLWGVGVNQPFNPQSGKCAPAPTEENKNTLRELLNGAALVTVRDEYSAEYLGAYTSQPVHLVGDPALHVNAVLELVPHGDSKKNQSVIGLNFPFHGTSSNKFLIANLPAYVNALRTIQDSTGCRFRYITHHACEYVVPRMLRAKGIALDIVHADLAGTCLAYQDLDLHIGGMLHSCILAASAGTPWIAIAYDIKHKGFNQLMGMDDYYQDTFEFSETALSALVLQALSRRKELRTHIATRREELQQHSMSITAAALDKLS